MPFVRISVVEGASSRYKTELSDSVHRALVEAFDVPAEDRFQVIDVHKHDELIYAPAYLGIPHTRAIVIIQITCNEGRTLDMKKALYKRINELITSHTDIGKNDIIVSLVEVKKENWSFGDGVAQYA